jgi:hypothetical protein
MPMLDCGRGPEPIAKPVRGGDDPEGMKARGIEALRGSPLRLEE